MLRVLFLISITLSLSAFVHSQENPQAYLFDEFGKISQTEIKLRTQKFKEKLRENRNTKNFNDGYLFFYYENRIKLKKIQNLTRDVLYKDCLDCFGFNVKITFVNAGKTKKQKTQFWIAPFGAKPPEPVFEEIK